MCGTKSIPNQWHKLSLEPRSEDLRPNCRHIRTVFPTELDLGGFSATKLRAYRARTRHGTCNSHIHKGVRLALDTVDQLIGPESWINPLGGFERQARRRMSRGVAWPLKCVADGTVDRGMAPRKRSALGLASAKRRVLGYPAFWMAKPQ